MRRLLLVALFVLASACGNGDAADEATRLIVQASGGESEIKAIEEMARAFEEQHGDVRVEVVGVASQGDHMARLATSFAAGEPPDIFLLNYRRFGQFAARGVIDPPEPLSPDEYYAEPLDAFTFEGRLLCLPQNVSSTVTYFNPALFAKAGIAPPDPTRAWTWSELRAAAEALHAARIEAIGFEHTMRTVAPFVWSAGGEVVDDREQPTRITFDSPEARAALSYLKGLLPFGIDAAQAAADPAEERFARGELAMFLDSRRAVPKLRKSEALQFDVSPLPLDRQPATLLASDAYCVAKAGGHKQAAHAFARFAVGPEGGRILARTGRTVPSHRGLSQSDEFLAPDKQPPSSEVWLDVIPTTMQLPNVGPWHETEENASEVLEQFFAGKLSLDDAVRRIAAESRRLLAR